MSEDRILFDRLKQDDRGAFEMLFKKYYASFCVVAVRYVDDPDVAKDIAQEVFIRLWDKRNDYAEVPSVKTFLYVLVKNACLNYIRNQKIKARHLDLIEAQGDLFFQQATIPEEAFRQLEAIIEKLPPQSANIMRLTMQGFSNTQIAEQLSVSVNTVKTLKYNALKNLRAGMSNLSVTALLVSILTDSV